MGYTQLRSFHAVAIEGSFTVAARKLGRSQPTITAQVRELEQKYDVELFHRMGNKIELSPLGRTLLSITQRFFSVEEEATELFDAASALRVGHLTIGVAGTFLAMKLLSALTQRHPGVQVSVLRGNSQEVLRLILNHRVDVGIFGYVKPDDRLHTIATHRHRLVLMVHREHWWACREGISLSELDGQRMVFRERGSNVRKVFAETLVARGNIKPIVAMEAESMAIFREAVAEGIGVGVIGEQDLVPDPRIQVLNLENLNIGIQTYLACLSARRHTRLIRAITDVVNTL